MSVKPRVLSLLPGATEMVWALGMTENLVGRSHECDFPSAVKKLPVVTSPAFATSGSSAEIDRAVKKQVHTGLSLYHVDAPKIAELKPDIILTQSHCEVCAVSEAELEKALGQSLVPRPKVVSLKPERLSDIWSDFLRVAETLGQSKKGQEKVALYQSKMEKIKERARALEPKPTVAAIEWIDPLMAAGNWMPELVEMAGGKNLFGKAGQHSPWLTYDELRARDPDVMLFLPCGFDIPRSRDELEPFAVNPGFFDMNAVKNNCVFLLDGNQYFNRAGPRVVDSLEILAEILHPDEFDFGHKNDGWEYWGFNRF